METWKCVETDYKAWKTYCASERTLRYPSCSSGWNDHIGFILLLCSTRIKKQRLDCIDTEGACSVFFIWTTLFTIAPAAKMTSQSVSVCVYPYFICSERRCVLYVFGTDQNKSIAQKASKTVKYGKLLVPNLHFFFCLLIFYWYGKHLGQLSKNIIKQCLTAQEALVAPLACWRHMKLWQPC